MTETNRIKVTKLYEKLEKAKAKVIVDVGGSGSSKTYSLLQFMLFERLLKKENIRLLLLRKTRQSNKLSIYKDFITILQKHGLYKEENNNKTDLIYTIPETGSYILFSGLEDRERIKSTQWHDIILEEGNEFAREDLTAMKLRLYRGEKEENHISRIWINLNPVECWIQELEGNDNVEFIYSTYKDNRFANQDYIDTLESLKDEDITYYNIYTLGKWGKAKGVIYKPFIINKIFPEDFEEQIYGLDFGFNNPSVLVWIGLKDNELYIKELLYKSGLTNGDLIEEMKTLIPTDNRDKDIYGDSAEPARIEEIYNEGFNIKAADKSVKDGIDCVKRFNIHTLSENVNINKERAVYKWKEDRNGNTLDEPVKFKDHCMDAMRYAIYSHFKKLICEVRANFI